MTPRRICSGAAIALLFAAHFFLAAPVAHAACANDASTQFRSAASGNWNNAATWECSDGVSWEAAVTTPTSAHGAITIRSGHTVTMSATVTYDQATVESGGQVMVASAVAHTLANGTGTDLSISGTWLNQGSTWTTTGAAWTVNAGGTFIHNTTSGIATPLNSATLNATSTFIYRGSDTLTPSISTSGRTYGHLYFESTSGTWNASPSGSGSLTVNGNFSIGSGVTYDTSQTGTMIFTGNFTNDGTLTNGAGTQTYQFNGSGKTIGGASGITFEVFNLNTGASITLARDVTLEAGFTSTNSSGTLNLGGYTLTCSGCTYTNNGTVTGSGTFRTQGTATLNQNSVFSAALNVNTGTATVTHDSSDDSFEGTITIESGATFRVASSHTIRADTNITVNGTLSGGSSSSTFVFRGATFTNNSAVSVATFAIENAGTHTLAGSGAWSGVSSLNVGSSGSPTLALANNITLPVTTLTVQGSCVLDLAGFMLTFTGSTFNNNGTTTDGTLRTQGTVTLNQPATFDAALNVNTGTTTVTHDSNDDSLDGVITVDNGATLQVATGHTIRAENSMTVNGTLSGAWSNSIFEFHSATFINNGSVTVPTFRFQGTSQTLSGTGSFSSNTTAIRSGSTTTLGSNHQLHSLNIETGGTLATSSFTLSLTGNWTRSGTFTPDTGTVNFNGVAAAPSTIQTFNSSTTFNNVTISSGAIVEAGASALMTVSGTWTHNGQVRRSPTSSTACGSSQTDATNQTTISLASCVTMGNATIKSAAGGSFPNTTIGSSTKYGDCTANSNVIRRYWEITPNVSGTANVTFRFRDAENSGVNLSDITVYKCVGTSWVAQESGLAASGVDGSGYRSVTASGLAIGSPFVLGGSSAPTAAALLKFKARARGEARVLLRWSTGTELTLIGFNIWRKTGKGEWKKLNADLIPARNPGGVEGGKYRWTDRKVKAHQTYHYKLELVTADGASEWSAIVKVKLP